LLETQGIEGWVRKQLAAESGRPIQDMMRYEHATWRLWIGDRNGALRELEGLFSVRPYDSMYLAADPAFTELRGDPRFQNVVQRMGLQRSR
jgi:hypothetical protein